jgi:Ca2+-binding RTX toxin-like protein
MADQKYHDVFWLQDPGSGKGDVALHFDTQQDDLRIVGGDFGIGGSLDGSELVNRSNGHAASLAKAQLIYDQGDKEIWYDADGTGADQGVRVVSFKGGGPGSLSTGDVDVV